MSSQVPTSIAWPTGIDTQHFLDHYWQKKPLLIRQAFPNFESPISADELAGLSIEPDTTPRLIIKQDDHQYQVETGPFTESRFSKLTQNNWSLLVSDTEKHLPELSDYLAPFGFLPQWRIDDLMISYAPVGASVGAHIDQYDVFLLQATGKRRWQIDANPNTSYLNADDSDLKLVIGFEPSHDWILEPGDMLYLPPGIAHHGISHEDVCTTWSIGFRAPLISETLLRFSEMITDDMADERYQDDQVVPTEPGLISENVVQTFQSAWQNLLRRNPQQLGQLLGKWLTEPGVPFDFPNQLESIPELTENLRLRKAPFSQFAWYPGDTNTEQVSLFVNGDCYLCAKEFAIAVCQAPLSHPLPSAFYSSHAELIQKLLYKQAFIIDEE